MSFLPPTLSKNEYLQISHPHPSVGPRGYSDVTQVFWDAAFITSNSRTAFWMHYISKWCSWCTFWFLYGLNFALYPRMPITGQRDWTIESIILYIRVVASDLNRVEFCNVPRHLNVFKSIFCCRFPDSSIVYVCMK